MKLILGTASFGPKPYGYGITETIPLSEIHYILEHAKRGGITILEGAEAYKCNELLQDKHFDLIYKARHPYNLSRFLDETGRRSFMGMLYHHGYDTKAESVLEDERVLYTGASVYEHKQLIGSEQMIEVPYNIENRAFENITAPCKLVRSVFGRGELLKKHSVKECLDFVKNNPTIHGVIVGVNSASELDQILEAWNK